jgi:hypothetical protein
MKQIAAIFMKDARRFWPEIAVSLLLLALFVIVYPVTWQQNGMMAETFAGSFRMVEGGEGFLAACLVVLVPVSWLVLIARVVHCERLVGDTQFWLTRPYEWPKLLAAKALFLAAFLYLPFLLAQCVLLIEAGFNPIAYAGALCLNLLLVTAILILPVIALASLTRGFARLMLVLLGFVVIFVVMNVIAAYMPRAGHGGAPDLISGDIQFFVLLAGCAVAVWIMYARRGVRAGWIAFGGALLLLCGMNWVDLDRALMERFFPANRGGAAPIVEMSYAAEGMRQPIVRDTRDKDELEVSIPITSSVLQSDQAVVPQALRVTVGGPGGTRWRSAWQRYGNAYFLPGSSVSSFNFFLPRRVYEQWKGASIGLNVEFALVSAKQTKQRTVALPDRDFAVDGFGICTPWSWYAKRREYSAITCRSAMRRPLLTYVVAPWAHHSCSNPADEEGDKMMATAWAGDLDAAPAQMGITSVWSTPLNFSNAWDIRAGAPGRPRIFCPGTPVVFRQFREQERMTVQLRMENFRFPEIMSAEQMSASN